MKIITKKNILFIIILIYGYVLFSQTNNSKKIVNHIKCPSVNDDIRQAFSNRIINIKNTYSSENFEDLEFLKKIIGDKKYVFLGESSHYVEEYSAIKERLIKYLHKEKGFDVLLFESDLFNCNTSYLICNSLTVSEFLENSIYDIWHTDVNYDLFNYIKESKDSKNPLYFSGFDIKKSNITDSRLLYHYYKNYLKAKDFTEFIALDTIINSYFNTVILNKNKKEYQSDLSQNLTDRCNELLNSINTYKANKERDIFKRIIQDKIYLLNIIRQANNNPQKYNVLRDKYMAENLEWFAEKIFPDKKIIIWAHNQHICDNPDLGKYIPEVPSMGHNISEKMKEQSYVIGLFGLKGNEGWKKHDVNYMKKNSLEAVICKTGNDISFIDFTKKFNIDYNKKIYLWEQEKSINKIKQLYDGLLFIRNISAAKYLH